MSLPGLRLEVEGRSWPHHEHSRMVEARGTRLHVQVMGEGPPLLLLHGTGASSHSYRELMPRLVARFTVIAPDLPGHGFSGHALGASSLPGMARAMAALLEVLDVAPIAVVGHSAGAAIAMQMVLDRFVCPRRVIGLAAALMPFRGVAGIVAPVAAQLLSRTSRLSARLIARRAGRTGQTERILASTGSTLQPSGTELYRRLVASPAHVQGALAMVSSWDVGPLLARLRWLPVPVLLLAGERDLAVPLLQQHELMARLPDARLHVVPRAGHLLHEEQPALVADLVEEELAA